MSGRATFVWRGTMFAAVAISARTDQFTEAAERGGNILHSGRRSRARPLDGNLRVSLQVQSGIAP